MRYNPKKHRLPVFKTDGVLLVDKPKEWTSFDVVNMVRSRFNVPKVGHCGTLDPAATGLLVLMLGRFTKLSQKFSGEDKVYEATMLLGTETDSQDMEGNVTAENDYSAITEEQARDVVLSFIGEQDQVPPMVSAVKKDGKRLYELARKGIEVEREAKRITVYDIEITRIELPQIDFTVKCSKGTYIRTLCADIGTKLGCGATLFNLRRTASGKFDLANAVDIDTIKGWEQPDLDVYVRTLLFEKVSKIAGI
ncbi:tRNA pseudouridine(55) synthase TruB [Lentisphaerota bacterium ZTH]|nr:tRNA pseudouridine(55) synthase TruB [Lentisphaerota bacterium]WET07628.1 tRNA pseudouridine(55) synthase TruB [Lentisphaerota bacterium ZTH]